VSAAKGSPCGTGTVQEKKQWPHWTPTAAMIARDPGRLREVAHGMEGALKSLGARALYLFKNGKDTRYRIHGTTEPTASARRFLRLHPHDEPGCNRFVRARSHWCIGRRSLTARKAGIGRRMYR